MYNKKNWITWVFDVFTVVMAIQWNDSGILFFYCKISCLNDWRLSLFVPEQQDDFLFPFNCTLLVKSMVSPWARSEFSVERSNFCHWRTAITNAAVTFCDVFADVSIKLVIWNSWHHAITSSGVICRSADFTSF